jgi:ABC-2 type transport system permease protein
MIRAMPLVALTLRGLLDRRRTWLMMLLAAMPVLTALAVALASGPRFTASVFDTLIVRTVLPLIALVFGTAALGSELEDHTIIYLLTKPIRRVRIFLAKGAVAVGLTAALVVPATLLTGLVAASITPRLSSVAIGYAIAVGIGGAAYVLAFLTLSTFTSRALALGLGYVLLWEGILSGLLDGTRMLSIRQATLGLAAELSGRPPRQAVIDGEAAVAILAVTIVGAIVLGSWRLSRFELSGGD